MICMYAHIRDQGEWNCFWECFGGANWMRVACKFLDWFLWWPHFALQKRVISNGLRKVEEYLTVPTGSTCCWECLVVLNGWGLHASCLIDSFDDHILRCKKRVMSNGLRKVKEYLTVPTGSTEFQCKMRSDYVMPKASQPHPQGFIVLYLYSRCRVYVFLFTRGFHWH